ncbi:hypothetical protein HUT19_18410 [Streptomyces sp. NA02950]|uniref:hypothetical protein n=1 Tax=Streptomyces sp. NA02950 TaxID=2742137 RepID=UPI0015924871|nr:hypothetical protein [Streptomyces sp. NA02950]QKV90350.1 hypothetical protein HUT19_18410 [Streptomyces sp. NA02950]
MALVEIDLYGDLMIAASSADEDRLSTDRIDEVLRVEADRSNSAERAKAERAKPDRAKPDRAAPGRAKADRPRSDRGADRDPGADQGPEAEVPDAG